MTSASAATHAAGSTSHPRRQSAKILLVHGMGRTPASFAWLALRLRARGLAVSAFAYAPALESFAGCTARLAETVRAAAGEQPCLVVGHSLGAVLLRGALPRLAGNPPSLCVFLAPPQRACRAARFFAGNPIYRVANGEMGQRLADPAFFADLPRPTMPTLVFAGTAGPRGRLSPFGDEPNDGILTVDETRAADGEPVIELPSLHTFIMNARRVEAAIAAAARR